MPKNDKNQTIRKWDSKEEIKNKIKELKEEYSKINQRFNVYGATSGESQAETDRQDKIAYTKMMEIKKEIESLTEQLKLFGSNNSSNRTSSNNNDRNPLEGAFDCLLDSENDGGCTLIKCLASL